MDITEKMPPEDMLAKAMSEIQNTLQVGKSKKNNHGGFFYRNHSDILSALKPSLAKYQGWVRNSNRLVGEFMEYKSEIIFPFGIAEANFYCPPPREPQKGMNMAQTFGAYASYGYKYGLSGLLGIDDDIDMDSDFEEYEKNKKTKSNPPTPPPTTKPAPNEDNIKKTSMDSWKEFTSDMSEENMNKIVEKLKEIKFPEDRIISFQEKAKSILSGIEAKKEEESKHPKNEESKLETFKNVIKTDGWRFAYDTISLYADKGQEGDLFLELVVKAALNELSGIELSTGKPLRIASTIGDFNASIEIGSMLPDYMKVPFLNFLKEKAMGYEIGFNKKTKKFETI